jgi:Ni/Co efflux regulator RcnB
MRKLILSAAASLLLAMSPAIAAPHHGGGGHATMHRSTTHRTTVHRNGSAARRRTVTRTRTVHRRVARNGTVHRTVTTRRNVRNVTALRGNLRSPRRYRFNGNWRRPSGWYAHRWAYGNRLPVGWFGASFWLSDYVAYGLIAPPDGYQWIREGNDAVLVDIDTGEVVRVEYDVFY